MQIRSVVGITLFTLAAWVLLLSGAPAAADTLPPNFIVENATPGIPWVAPVELAFLPDGRWLVAEKRGRVWAVKNGMRHATPMWEGELEVLDQNDRGFLGLAVDPNFATNRYIYLLYTVDPDTNGVDVAGPGFGRLTRYQVSASDSNVVDPSSRTILMGRTWTEGPLIASGSHTIGCLRFGTDGSLFVGAGDGANYGNNPDDGGEYPTAFGPGKTDPAEDIGALRSQYLGSLAGKILRLDPLTGWGYPGNPFFDGDPRSVRSRVWVYGLRNPYRFAVEPGSGSTHPADGQPGVLHIGDVGWKDWEELSIATQGGRNFGWPCYEGPIRQNLYWPPMAAPAHCGCDSLGLTFHSPADTTSPISTWFHSDPAPSNPPGIIGQTALGGVFYKGRPYPPAYRNRLFMGDYGSNWIKVLVTDSQYRMNGVLPFAAGAIRPVTIATEPVSGDLLYIAIFASEIRRIRYTGPVDNVSPVAVATGAPLFGPAPLEADFSAAGTSDADQDSLGYAWLFGDGDGSNGPNPTHVYTEPGLYHAVLTVTDPFGGLSRDTVDVLVSAPNTIAALSPAGCISTANPCRAVPVAISRTETTAIRAYSVRIQLSTNLELCSTPAASITQGPYLSSIGTTSFQIVSHGGGSYTVDCAILGAPCGATAASGTLFNVAVKKATGGSDGTGTVSIGTVLLRDCPNGPLAVDAGGAASIPIDTVAPAALATVASAQVMSGNDANGTTKITVTWSGAEVGASAAVYRKGFGSYPEYDDAGGAVPAVPATPAAALGSGWTLTGVTTPGGQDEPATRDFWYYVAFLTDACGNVSAVSNLTGGSLNYHLGDVSDGVTAGAGNNAVFSEDISLLGANYGLTGGAMTAVNYLDVGPTTNFSASARPTTDNAINFEDLVMFAINFDEVSAPGVITDRPAAGVDELSLVTEGTVAAGSELGAKLVLSGSGRVQALSAPLRWNMGVVEPLGTEVSLELLAAGGVALSPTPGTVDAALLGVREIGMAGEIELATVRFRVKRAGDPGIALGEITARDAQNRPVTFGMSGGSTGARPASTALLGASPNPFHSGTLLAYSLAQPGRVELSIYTVGGRRAKTLVLAAREAGFHSVTWDGTDEAGHRMPAGVYYAAFAVGDGARQSRTVILLDR